PARSIDETATSTSCRWITCSIGIRWTRTSNIDRSSVSGFVPWDIVRFPCGSRSTTRTRWPCSANATPRLSVVVVFATPPFWFANAITVAEPGAAPLAGRTFGRGSRRARPILLIAVRAASGHSSRPSTKFAHGRERPLVALAERPLLGLVDARADLGEEVAGRRAALLELLESVESGQHAGCAVHPPTVALRL